LTEHRLFPWLWLLVTALLALAAWRWAATPGAIDSDILSLLEERTNANLVSQAQSRLGENAARRVLVLVGGGDLASAVRAADASYATLKNSAAFARIEYQLDPARAQELQTFYAPHRTFLLTPAQRAALQADDRAALIDQALRGFYSPVGAPGALALMDDPFQLFAAWQQERGAATRVRPLQDRLVVLDGERHYVALLLEIAGSAFDQQVQQRVGAALAAAKQAAQPADFLSAGVVNFALAVQQQAQREISLIGAGSMLGIVLLILAAFHSWRPLLLALLPIGFGCVAAIAVCSWVFGRIHIFTLVFGSSLVGVSVDYGLHFLCHTRAGDDRAQRFARLRRLLPGLTLALATSVLAYLTLALPAFPGLRQMALFSAVGLLAAWLTTVLWLPWLARGGLARQAWLPRTLQALQHLRLQGRVVRTLAVLLLLASAWGLTRTSVNDDVRLLQNLPPQLLAEQQRVADLAGVASPAQFLLVHAATPEAVLQTEERLAVELDTVRASGLLGAYQAVSLWVPSQQRQRQDHHLLTQKLYAEGGWLDYLGSQVGLPAAWLDTSRAAHAAAQPLTLQAWLDAPASSALRHLWLGRVGEETVSVVALQGLKGQAGSSAVRAAAQRVPGVTWVDRAGDFSQLLQTYRIEMAQVAAGAYVLVFAALLWRYRRAALRVVAPTVLASLITLGCLGWLSIPVNLFTVLALLLVLGVGIDYGIYMEEERSDPDSAAWIGVSLSAMTTLLSFGLLALSQTPALQTFGLTMLLGVGLSWGLARGLRRCA